LSAGVGEINKEGLKRRGGKRLSRCPLRRIRHGKGNINPEDEKEKPRLGKKKVRLLQDRQTRKKGGHVGNKVAQGGKYLRESNKGRNDMSQKKKEYVRK